MIYLMTIKTGFVGLEEYYLCHESDDIYDIASMDEITSTLSGYIGCYPSIEEIMKDMEISEEDAYEEQQRIIQEDIHFVKTPATLKDLNSVDLFPYSILHTDEGYEYTKKYIEYLNRDNKIKELLKD